MTAESTFAHSCGKDARILMRCALWASLATFDRQTGYPYVSLIAVATNVSGDPLFLISTLARHTQNLEFDARASILFSATGTRPDPVDPMDSGRVSVMGRAGVTEDSACRERFLARHPETAEYAVFSDFALWKLTPELGHYVGGFGRIHSVPASELRLEGPDVDAFAAGQALCVKDFNERPSLMERLVTEQLDMEGAPEYGASGCGASRASGIDPEGCDFIRDRQAIRLDFGDRMQNLAELSVLLEKLAAGK
jgi:putative heme iron utilization protein